MSRARDTGHSPPTRSRPSRKPLVVGPRALLSLLLAWAGVLTTAFLLGMRLA